MNICVLINVYIYAYMYIYMYVSTPGNAKPLQIIQNYPRPHKTTQDHTKPHEDNLSLIHIYEPTRLLNNP